MEFTKESALKQAEVTYYRFTFLTLIPHTTYTRGKK